MKQVKSPVGSKLGLSSSAIKYTGLVMMVFDHLFQMFSAQGIPQWFHWIGRPVLPMFLFICAESFWHTGSRAKYMLRLAICCILMSMGNLVLSRFLPVHNIDLINNVFQTLLLATFYMLCIEILRAGILEKRHSKTVGAIALMVLPIAYGLLLFLISAFPYWLRVIYFFIPNLLITEGGFSAVILGVLFYLFRKNRIIQVSIVVAYSILAIILTFSRGAGLFSGSSQWLLIFAIIPILLYNGERGRGKTFFFYIFYPAHIYLFYIIAWFIGRT